MIPRRLSGPDFLTRLDELHAVHGGVFPGRPGEVYVADPAIAREILGNAAGHYREHSDFFRIRTGTFGPRAAQVGIGRAARQLLDRHHRAHAASLPGLVARRLAPSSAWPDAGNRLVFGYFAPVLVGAEPSEALRDTVSAVVERAVLAGARERYSLLTRARFRGRVMRVLAAEIAARRTARGKGDGPDADLLDVLARAAPPGSRDRDLAEVYLSCLFAVAGSVGFLLGWSVYLAGTAGPDAASAPPAWVVREALRLWPVAWLFGRRPVAERTLDGVAVTPADEVRVCGYLVHRDPAHWPDPHEFRPQRWAAPTGREAFVPFGWGPHACTGASVSMQVVEALLGIITATYAVHVTAPDSRPQVAAALAPPRFTLRLDQTDDRSEGR
ncbi:cytochrome P450 [Virgisporangium aliadipatigenens]|uniref:Cytochrome P450 n=1 Tax=Virgisporangium aliadipatigenens TaxID=741659 RepID=A0A8J3YTQ9_9ACTN|nr:cytochrome P450 [Virgisporangium aliadipatigenens]GIJ49656.1 cytochrome P450 [Virgisporangium aliadipatigenens]